MQVLTHRVWGSLNLHFPQGVPVTSLLMALSTFFSGRAAPTPSAQGNQLRFREALEGKRVKSTRLFPDFDQLSGWQGM